MTQMLRVARDEALTVRQFVMRFGFPKDSYVGTAEDVADEMQEWFDGGGGVRRLHAGGVTAGSAALVCGYPSAAGGIGGELGTEGPLHGGDEIGREHVMHSLRPPPRQTSRRPRA